MANKNQLFEANTTFIGTRGVKEYRETIPVWINSNDIVLELGCEWGTTTTLIAQHCKEVIATDISPKCIGRAREMYPDLHFEVMDGFDVKAALDLDKPFSKIYIDISGLSGYNSTLDTISLLMMYANVLRPEAIIVKSGALKRFAAHCIAWKSPSNRP
ncbi:class I SAM-dependent methyltransferase [Candidatus Poribacteria bacterium]|nr:class I SAM-dependent methyltransferase [Candidatus Poribacteria bacterium]